MCQKPSENFIECRSPFAGRVAGLPQADHCMVVEEPASQSRPSTAGHRTDPPQADATHRAYFTDPATIPLVRLLWNSKKNRMHGATPSRADDAVVVGSMKFWP